MPSKHQGSAFIAYQQPNYEEMGVDMLFVFNTYPWQTASSFIANVHEAQQPIIRMSQEGS